MVFKDLSLQVRRGERLAIIGESGAGKSTLLHLLGGLDRPSERTILFGDRGHCLAGATTLWPIFATGEIGFVWQNPSLLPEFTALENVMMPLLIRGVTPDEAARAALMRLEEVGLKRALRIAPASCPVESSSASRWPARWSETRKVLLADEPTGNLDFRTGETIMNLLERVARVSRIDIRLRDAQSVVRGSLRSSFRVKEGHPASSVR